MGVGSLVVVWQHYWVALYVIIWSLHENKSWNENKKNLHWPFNPFFAHHLYAVVILNELIKFAKLCVLYGHRIVVGKIVLICKNGAIRKWKKRESESVSKEKRRKRRNWSV